MHRSAAVAFTFDLLRHQLSLSLSECRSVTALFVLLESLQNGVPSKGPFVCRFDYERAISPPGADGAHPQVTAGVCGCIFVCVCERVRNNGTVR